MTMNLVEIESLIKEALPDAVINIRDLAGDGNHYSATVSSALFKGKTKIEILNNFKHRVVCDINVEFIEAKQQVKKIANLRIKEITKND